MPPAGHWHADRPGDLVAGQPTGTLLGRPGPNIGYALTLVNRWKDRFRLVPGEHYDDAAHDYPARRELVDRVPDDVLRLAPSYLSSRVAEFRRDLLGA